MAQGGQKDGRMGVPAIRLLGEPWRNGKGVVDRLDGLEAAEDIKLGATRLRGAPVLGANLHYHLQLSTSRNTAGQVSLAPCAGIVPL